MLSTLARSLRTSLLMLPLLVAACSGGGDDTAEGSADLTASAETVRLAAVERVTPVLLPSAGIWPADVAATKAGVTQGFYAGKDDDGAACTVHVIHYAYADYREVYVRTWRDGDVLHYRAYDPEMDASVVGVERETVIERTTRHQLSISTTNGADSFSDDGSKVTLRQKTIVKGLESDDVRTVEYELFPFDLPSGGITVRIKKLGFDEVQRCHGLTPKADAHG